MTVSPAHIEFKLRQAYPDFSVPVTKSQESSATPVWLQSQETRDPYFQGAFSLTPALSKAQASYLQAFLAVQHGFWPIEHVQQQSDSLREAVGLPLGEDAAFYVGHFSNGLKGCLRHLSHAAHAQVTMRKLVLAQTPHSLRLQHAARHVPARQL